MILSLLIIGFFICVVTTFLVGLVTEAVEVDNNWKINESLIKAHILKHRTTCSHNEHVKAHKNLLGLNEPKNRPRRQNSRKTANRKSAIKTAKSKSSKKA